MKLFVGEEKLQLALGGFAVVTLLALCNTSGPGGDELPECLNLQLTVHCLDRRYQRLPPNLVLPFLHRDNKHP